MFYRKLFLKLLLTLLLLQSIYHYTGTAVIKFLIYGIELVFIIVSLLMAVKKANRLTGKFFYFAFLMTVFFLGLVVNGFNGLEDIIKILGGISIFLATYYMFSNFNDFTKREKLNVIFISVTPFMIYLLDIILGYKESPNSLSIFSNSNNYIFFSICCVWLMMLYDISKRFLLGFIAISFVITSTLGSFLAVFFATIFYFRKRIFKPRYLLLFIVLILFAGTMVLYSDLYLFERLRGTGNVFFSLINEYSPKEFAQISFGEAMTLSGSSDGSDVSFLFRIKLWNESILYFFNQNIIYILFGLGFGSIPEINSFGLVAHNDYLTWLIESGILGFTLIIIGIWFGFSKLKNTIYIIPYLAILIYFFTENLFYNFFAIAIFGFCMAISLQNVKNENFTD